LAVCIAVAVVIGTQLISRIGESWPSQAVTSLLIFVLLAVLKNVLLGAGHNRVFPPVTEGAQHVPVKGAATIASDHSSFADWSFVPLALDRRITFVAKSDYFTGVLVRDTGDSFGDHWHRYHRARQDHHQDHSPTVAFGEPLDFAHLRSGSEGGGRPPSQGRGGRRGVSSGLNGDLDAASSRQTAS
jgi:hypothetical protein